jgi:hypothetical protein
MTVRDSRNVAVFGLGGRAGQLRRVAAAAIDPQKSNGASLAQKRPKFPGISPAVPDIVFPTLNKRGFFMGRESRHNVPVFCQKQCRA